MLTQRFPFLRTRRGIAIVVGMVLLIIGAGLAGLAALHRGGGGGGAAAATTGNSSDGVITNDTYFYGMSPPVYPSRKFGVSLPHPNGEHGMRWEETSVLR